MRQQALCFNVYRSLRSTRQAARRGLIFMMALGLTSALSPDTLADTGESASQLEELVITATRTSKPILQVPASITLQNADELLLKGFSVGTDELRGVPGVFFRRGEGDGDEFPFIAIRGVTGNHGNDTFLALVDGIPFVGPDEEVLLYEVPYPVVESIEIVRGPVSALYGRGAIAGAINYRTKIIGEDGGEFYVSAGNEGYKRAGGHVERRFENGVGLLANMSLEDVDGWRENSDRRIGSAFVKGEFPIDDDKNLTGWLTYYDRDASVPSVIPTTADGVPLSVAGGSKAFLGYAPTYKRSEGVVAAMRYTHELSASLSYYVTAQLRRYESDIRLNFYDFFEFKPENNIMSVNGFASKNKATVGFVESAFEWRRGAHTVVAGLSIEQASLDERDFWSGENDPFFSGECNFRFYAILIDYSTGQVVNDTPDNACFVRNQLRTVADTTNRFYGAFIQDEIALSQKLTLTLGLRYDAFERDVNFDVIGAKVVDQKAKGDADAVAPKLTLAYDIGMGMLYSNYSRGFNSNFGPVWQWEPDRYERVEKSTTIDSYELGWKGLTSDKRVSWGTALFYLEQDDRRIFVTNPDPTGPPTLATTGRAYSSRGFEGEVNVQLTPTTHFQAAYTYTDAQWDDLLIAGSFGSPDQDYSGVTPQGVPEHMIYAELSHEFGGGNRVGVTYEWYDDYYVDLSNSVSDGSYNLVGIYAKFQVPSIPSLSLDLSVTNLLDEDYYFYFAGSRTQVTNVTPGVPRMMRAKLRWRF